ncbi:putative mucin/carbohydrate-binding domain-containing protein [Sodalis glossinidius]|uniref:putative mucin/carbohydrate-binding domain-containing protein n=1 Tax=Sodalis glossinidius TaxID=63612 RepID=UPI000320CB15|nr:putative mucin/carbohydrate-binding domain-containing protein [Sodalis glossinidius]
MTLLLLNDGRKTEASFSVGRNWEEVSVNAVSVPFIETPYVNGAPMVEIEYPETSKILPVYRKGENEAAFFERWNSQDAEFALVDSGYAVILVPKISKPALQTPGNVENIDALITYYEDIFTFYNALSGLSFEAEHDSDWNINNRYLMKSDKKDDSNGGYYGGNWPAESSASVSSFWLTPQASNWGSLHEIAHGYQGHFMTDKHFSVGEVWNNIYAASYQDVMLGDRKYQDGWLYDYSNKAKVEETIFQLIAREKPLNQWDLHSKLYFIMLMVDKAGKNAFTFLNQQYRKNCNTSDFAPYLHSLLDILSESFAIAGEQVDVTPFVQLTGGHVTQPQCDRNKFSHAKAVYPLYQLVDKPQLEAVKNQLKLDSTLRLVDATQLKATGLKGNVSLRFNIDDFAQIYGKDLILLEEARYAYKIRIDSPTMTLGDLPIGVYTLRLPTGKDRKYQPTTDYLIVKQGDNAAEIAFIKKFASPIISQEINFLGIADEFFAMLLVDHAQGKLVIDVFTTTPHHYFPGVTYAKIIVRDPQGKITFTKEIPGTEASLIHDELLFSVGDQIKIFHKEPTRLRVNPPYPDIIDSKNVTNILTIPTTD